MTDRTIKQRGRLRFIGRAFIKYIFFAAAFIVVITYFSERNQYMDKLQNLVLVEELYMKNNGLTNPEAKIAYVKGKDPFGIFLEVGVYPKLTYEVKEELRSRGRPYSEWYVIYAEAEAEKPY